MIRSCHEECFHMFVQYSVVVITLYFVLCMSFIDSVKYMYVYCKLNCADTVIKTALC